MAMQVLITKLLATATFATAPLLYDDKPVLHFLLI